MQGACEHCRVVGTVVTLPLVGIVADALHREPDRTRYVWLCQPCQFEILEARHLRGPEVRA